MFFILFLSFEFFVIFFIEKSYRLMSIKINMKIGKIWQERNDMMGIYYHYNFFHIASSGAVALP